MHTYIHTYIYTCIYTYIHAYMHTHTHITNVSLIYGYMASDIWLRTILIVREETCCCHIGYSFRLAARVILLAPSHRIAHTSAFVTPVVEHWLKREIAHWVHHKGSIRRPIAPWANALTTELHLAPNRTENIHRMYFVCSYNDTQFNQLWTPGHDK